MNDKILSQFSYNPETGVLLRNGKPCGGLSAQGYRQVRVGGKTHLEHRVIWFLTYGELPAEIDHINRVRDDNRLCNLRAADRFINAQNRRELGISWCKKSEKWRVRRMRFHKSFNLGYFDDYFEACCASLRF